MCSAPGGSAEAGPDAEAAGGEGDPVASSRVRSGIRPAHLRREGEARRPRHRGRARGVRAPVSASTSSPWVWALRTASRNSGLTGSRAWPSRPDERIPPSASAYMTTAAALFFALRRAGQEAGRAIGAVTVVTPRTGPLFDLLSERAASKATSGRPRSGHSGSGRARDGLPGLSSLCPPRRSGRRRAQRRSGTHDGRTILPRCLLRPSRAATRSGPGGGPHRRASGGETRARPSGPSAPSRRARCRGSVSRIGSRQTRPAGAPRRLLKIEALAPRTHWPARYGVLVSRVPIAPWWRSVTFQQPASPAACGRWRSSRRPRRGTSAPGRARSAPSSRPLPHRG